MKKPKIKKFKRFSKLSRLGALTLFAGTFGMAGVAALLLTRAAPGACSTTDVIGTATYNSVSVPETATYKVWVRMQVPDTSNSGNNNGVRLELDNNQCFILTTTSSGAVNQWQWVNSSATSSSTAHVTSQLSAGSHTAKILGMKAGVKVDKVLLLKSDSNCTPDNTKSGSREPGDNCTTDAPTLNFTANPASVVTGTSSTLTWSASNASSCTASGAWSGNKNTSGSQSTGNLTSNQTYTLQCTGVGGTVTRNVTVTVTAAPPPTDTTKPTVTMTIPGVTTTGQSSATVNNQRSISWQPLASDSSGIKSLVLTVNGQAVSLSNGTVTVGANANGDYELRAVATDNADNVTTSTFTIRLRHPDFNRSGKVDIFDLSSMLSQWNNSSSVYDINVSGKVDVFDLSFVLSRWNSTD